MAKTNAARITGTAEAWETRALGASEEHIRRVDPAIEAQIEEALAMQAISIRLPKSTIDTYKALAKMHGVGYQPLMRDAICRWAEAELKQMVIAAAATTEDSAPHASRGKHGKADPHAPVKRAA